MIMKKLFFLLAAAVCSFPFQQGHADDIKIASIPDVNVTPSLQSVLRQKDSILQETQAQEATGQEVQISTNGYVLDNGNIVVDNLVEPKCVFYGNYNDGSGDAFQYIDIDTLVLNCQ
jgi:hypothetical protein